MLHTVVFRSGADKGYNVWPEFAWLPVISVAPVRRPKLDGTGADYSFEAEKEYMKEKIRVVLRVAAAWNHRDLCVGTFGAGPGFRNPIRQLASMWKGILYSEEEFQGAFSNICFAIERNIASGATGESTDYEVFKEEFDPSNVCKTTYR